MSLHSKSWRTWVAYNTYAPQDYSNSSSIAARRVASEHNIVTTRYIAARLKKHRITAVLRTSKNLNSIF